MVALTEPPRRGQWFLGTALCLDQRTAFATAAHCVRGLSASEVEVRLGPTEEQLQVEQIVRHPVADIAILRVPDHPDVRAWYFSGGVIEGEIDWQIGRELGALGFPEDVFSLEARHPTPRLFHAYLQRGFDHKSFRGYEYIAMELSIGAPAGLSGGPVFGWGANVLFGMVTENYDSTTSLEQVEELTDDGVRRTIETRRVISYGIALDLRSVAPWIEEVLGEGVGRPGRWHADLHI